MAEFKKYQHLERFGTSGVNGINVGRCFIFPKIDGTNSSIWFKSREHFYDLSNPITLGFGSRNRELTTEKDNAAFMQMMMNDKPIIKFFDKYGSMYRLYGEWLVPHTLKTYRETAWKRFYVFDVVLDEQNYHVPYEEYKEMLDEFGIEYIPPIKIINNPTYEDLVFQMQQNDYLIQDGMGYGEGIVIKNYDFVNQYGRTVWAKIVSSEFKENNKKKFGAPEQGGEPIELLIAKEFVTKSECQKEFSKIFLEENGWNSKMIPHLLNSVFHYVVIDEMWNILKKYKKATINFGMLYHFTINRVKENLPDLFQ